MTTTTWRLAKEHNHRRRAPRWYLDAHIETKRYDPHVWANTIHSTKPVMMVNSRRQRPPGSKGKRITVWMVHKAKEVHNGYGFTSTHWEYLTWTETLDEAKSVANLIYASQQLGE